MIIILRVIVMNIKLDEDHSTSGAERKALIFASMRRKSTRSLNVEYLSLTSSQRPVTCFDGQRLMDLMKYREMQIDRYIV